MHVGKGPEQEDGRGSEQGADEQAQFDRAPAVAQEAPDGTGQTVGAVFEAEVDSDEDGLEAELPEHLRLEVDGQEAVGQRGHDERAEGHPDGRDGEDRLEGDGLHGALVVEGLVVVGQEGEGGERHDRLDAAHDEEGQLEAARLVEGAADDRTRQLGNVHHGPRQALQPQPRQADM